MWLENQLGSHPQKSVLCMSKPPSDKYNMVYLEGIFTVTNIGTVSLTLANIESADLTFVNCSTVYFKISFQAVNGWRHLCLVCQTSLSGYWLMMHILLYHTVCEIISSKSFCHVCKSEYV
jgi:hypothetical protein